MTRERCGAKTRAGTPCQQWPLEGKRRCKFHGGASTGPAKGNQNAAKHGIYGTVLTDEEKARWKEIQLGKVDDEIRLWRTRLVRALAAEQAARDKPELEEIVARKIGGENQPTAEKRYTRRDYAALIDRIGGRIESLEKTRMELMKTDSEATEQTEPIVIQIQAGSQTGGSD